MKSELFLIFINEYIYWMFAIKEKVEDRKKTQFYHQNGWIVNNFKSKNNVATVLKWKHRNSTDLNQAKHT